MTLLSLGTAQFGLRYGITNTAGIVPPFDVQQILAYASRSGIRHLDTAHSYGKAEAILGSCISPTDDFLVTTKLAPYPHSEFDISSFRYFDQQLEDILSNLKATSIYALLLHSHCDLHKSGSQYLIDWLRAQKSSFAVGNLGVSIYAESDLDFVPDDLLDVVQLPVSLYDQTHIRSNLICRLANRDIKVFARSVFLQGLLLTPPSSLPPWCTDSFIQTHLQFQHLCSELQLSMLEVSLSYLRQIEGLHSIIVGCIDLTQITEIVTAWNNTLTPFSSHDLGAFHSRDLCMIDPRQWPQ